MKLRWIFVFLLLTKASSAQGLIYSTDRLYRSYLSQAALTTNGAIPFLGYYLTGFEKIPLIEPDSFLTQAILKPRLLETSYANFEIFNSSIHETPVTVPAIGTAQYPVRLISFLTESQGLDVPLKESSWAKADLEFRPTSCFLARSVLHGGTNWNTQQGWYHLQQLFGEVRVGKAVLSIGRKPIVWGLAENPMLVSDNATPFDSIQLTTMPVRWPWWFSYFGQMKSEIFLARTNEQRSPGKDYFAGWRIGATFLKNFEANLGMIYQFGGKNIPKSSSSDIWVEILGGRRILGPGIDDTTNATNRAFQFDFRYSLPDLQMPTTFISETHFEDCCGFRNTFARSSSFTFALHFLSSKDPHPHRFYLEYTNIGDKTYYHSTWQSGASNEGRLFGNPLGRDAQRFMAKWAKDFSNFGEVEFISFLEERESTADLDRGTIFDIRPNYYASERRLGTTATYRRILPRDFILSLSLGLIRVFFKEDQNGRNTWEYGETLSLSRTF
jgi:hypothetical protein